MSSTDSERTRERTASGDKPLNGHNFPTSPPKSSDEMASLTQAYGINGGLEASDDLLAAPIGEDLAPKRSRSPIGGTTSLLPPSVGGSSTLVRPSSPIGGSPSSGFGPLPRNFSASTSTTSPARQPIARHNSNLGHVDPSHNPYASTDPDSNNPYSPVSPSFSQHTSSSTSPSHSRHLLSSPGASRLPLSDPGSGGYEVAGPKPFFDSEAYWLGLYFFFNLGLTLFNKIVLVSFPFPYTLTGLHALSGCIGCYFALERGSFTPAHLTSQDSLILAAFSILYTINIAVSNLSLQLVTVPFHQVVRAATPLFTIMISVVILRASFSRVKILSLLPVIAGVGFATYGDYYFTPWGLILTLIGTGLAALKTVATNLIQTGGGGRLKLHPLDLLMRMSPLAFIQCVIYGWWTGEIERVRAYGAREMDRTKALALLINGVIAFGLNVVSFTANKKTSALTMTVSANVKQVLTIVLAVFIFDLTISPINCLGIVLTLFGGALYAYIEYKEGRKKAARKISH